MIKDLSEHLLRRARYLGLSQTDVAQRAGLTREMVNRLINGKISEPSLSTLARLAYALDEHPRALSRLLMEGSSFDSSADDGTAMDDSGFVRDVTFPDGTLVSCSQRFRKTWKLQNLGNVVWTDRLLRCFDEVDCCYRKVTDERQQVRYIPIGVLLIPEVQEVLIPITRPGAVVELSVNFTAPATPGSTLSRWRMVDAEGALCFPDFPGIHCLVQVVSCG